MTQEEVYNAVEEMRGWTRLAEEEYKNGGEYISVSARHVLKELHYGADEQNEVLDFMHANGFNYCLDPRFPSRTMGTDEPTPAFACVWGIDQLRSRLDSVYVPYRP